MPCHVDNLIINFVLQCYELDVQDNITCMLVSGYLYNGWILYTLWHDFNASLTIVLSNICKPILNNHNNFDICRSNELNLQENLTLLQ